MARKRLFSTEEFVKIYMATHKAGGTRMDVVTTLLGDDAADERERSRFYNVVTQRIRSLNERLTSRGYSPLPQLAAGQRGGSANSAAELENIASLIEGGATE